MTESIPLMKMQKRILIQRKDRWKLAGGYEGVIKIHQPSVKTRIK